MIRRQLLCGRSTDNPNERLNYENRETKQQEAELVWAAACDDAPPRRGVSSRTTRPSDAMRLPFAVGPPSVKFLTKS